MLQRVVFPIRQNRRQASMLKRIESEQVKERQILEYLNIYVADMAKKAQKYLKMKGYKKVRLLQQCDACDAVCRQCAHELKTRKTTLDEALQNVQVEVDRWYATEEFRLYCAKKEDRRRAREIQFERELQKQQMTSQFSFAST